MMVILVYYFMVHQSAEPGREADVARGDTDRPTINITITNLTRIMMNTPLPEAEYLVNVMARTST